jgi:peptide deformylase
LWKPPVIVTPTSVSGEQNDWENRPPAEVDSLRSFLETARMVQYEIHPRFAPAERRDRRYNAILSSLMLPQASGVQIPVQLSGIPLKIITYPHPTLRRVATTIKRVDAELKNVVRQMFDLMYAAKGIGLAANQVDIPLRLFVINLEAEAGKGEELVFINPIISRPKGSAEAEEGCLSLPGLYGPVVRPKQVHVNAYSLSGEEISATVTGLFARCIQHELDHLDGVLFPDRMSDTARAGFRDSLNEFETDFQSRQSVGEYAPTAIQQSWLDWAKRYS